MNETERKNLPGVKDAQESATPSTGSLENPRPQEQENTPSINYTRSSVEHLIGLAKEVTSNKKTSKTVGAACACYAQIYKFLRLNLDFQKMLPKVKQTDGEASEEEESLRQDRVYIQKVKEALTRYSGNKTHAAEALGVSIRSLRNWVRECDELSQFRQEQSL